MEHYSTGEENGQNPELYDQDINNFVLQTLTVLERYAAQDNDHTLQVKKNFYLQPSIVSFLKLFERLLSFENPARNYTAR